MYRKVRFRLTKGLSRTNPEDMAVMLMRGLGGQIREVGWEEIKRRLEIRNFETFIEFAVNAHDWYEYRRNRSFIRKVLDFVYKPLADWYYEHTHEWVFEPGYPRPFEDSSFQKKTAPRSGLATGWRM